MRAYTALVVFLFTLLLAPSIAQAQFTAEAFLSGLNERPTPHNTTATGDAVVIYDPVANNLTYTVTFADLSAPATVSHIHFGGPNVAGPVILPFTNQGPPSAVSGSFSGILTTADLINTSTSGITTIAQAANAIQAGNAYVNIHDSVFPGGELRGQLVVTAAPEPGACALLTGLGVTGLGLLVRRKRLPR